MKRHLLLMHICSSVAGGLLLAQAALAADPYEHYVRTSEDFHAVNQEPAWIQRAFPSWTFMPWTYQWPLGYNAAAGHWCREHGYNGAFVDHGDIAAAGSPTGRLDWINQFQLRFYLDHAAGKGRLHLWDGDQVPAHLAELHATGVRPVPLNAATRTNLEARLRTSIAAVKSSPYRAAYALDDEPSWGSFVRPTMWQVTDDPATYSRWLTEVYGPAAPHRTNWVSYEDLRPRLAEWSIAEFDASPLLDQWSFNDSQWANLIGRLVTYANTLDPATPCGIVGGQMPSPFGGYDYAKLMRKVQFIESYNLGSAQAVIRSFNPHNALPAVTTLFHRSAADDIWQIWYYLAHGNRGHIAWVEGWFDGQTPQPWHEQVAPTCREAAETIGPLLRGAQWQHDGVALYYSQASIQLGWMLDAEAHGKTWGNRNSDDRLGSAPNVRRAWENLLRDTGLQYNFLSYADVIQHGVPAEYRVLILPACLCLSDAEARAIRAFCARGGTVIADYLPGLWDQHGKGRAAGGVLDEMFGVRHPPTLRAADVFGKKLWVEVDQDANYSWKNEAEFLTNQNTCLRVDGFAQAVRTLPTRHIAPFGRGRAVLLNLSPQWYNACRAGGSEAAARDIFMQPLAAAGVAPWVRIANVGEHPAGYEITYWTLPTGRTLLFVCANPGVNGTELGGGSAVSLKTNLVPITLHFDRIIHNVRNERTHQTLATGSDFKLDWKQNEAAVISFDPH